MRPNDVTRSCQYDIISSKKNDVVSYHINMILYHIHLISYQYDIISHQYDIISSPYDIISSLAEIPVPDYILFRIIFDSCLAGCISLTKRYYAVT